MQIANYEITSDKLTQDFCALFFSDLHALALEAAQTQILQLCRDKDVAAVFIPGDVVIARHDENDDKVYAFLAELAALAPVYFSNGNHESCRRFYETADRPSYRRFVSEMRKAGVQLLNNQTLRVDIAGNDICLAGLELPLSAYKKFHRWLLRTSAVEARLGKADPKDFTILLAHNPHFADAYFEWGADLTLSGHVHGGLARHPKSGRALMDPYGFPLPRYGYGHYEKDGRHLIVTSGLGDHFIKWRFCNPREVVLLCFHCQ